MAANVTISTLSQLGATKYSRKALFFAEPHLILQQFGNAPESLDQGWTQIIFTRFVPIPDTTTPDTVTSSGTFTAAKKTNVQQVTVTPALLAQGEDFDLFDSRRMFLNYVSGAAKIYGDWMGRYLNYLLAKEISLYATHIVANLDGNYMAIGTSSSDGTTTTVVDTDFRTEADDYWNNGYITMTSGPCKGITGTISDFVNSTGTVTIDSTNASASTFMEAPNEDDTYRICTGSQLADSTAFRLNAGAVRRAVRILKQAFAPTWDGFYVGVVDSANEDDFLTNIVSTLQYTEKGITQIFKGEIGYYLGVRWVRVNELYREAVASTEDRGDGVVSNVLIFGRDAFGMIPVKAGSTMPDVIVKTPGPHYSGVVAADANLQGMVSVKAVSAPKMLNAMNCVSIMTYPTVA